MTTPKLPETGKERNVSKQVDPTTMAPADLAWPRTFFKLPPELGDGQSWTLCETDKRGVENLLDLVRDWAENNGAWKGEAFKVEVIEMGKREFDALPEV